MTKPDFDIGVVGAGPAGIAAAVRARWLKRYLMVPAKVVLIDPASLGGLTQMGSTHLVGPGWRYDARELNHLLTMDVEKYRIPHIRDRITNVMPRGGLFQITLAGGSKILVRAVILCPGMKLLTREPLFWNRGVVATSMGVQAVSIELQDLLANPKNRRIVFVGTDRLTNLLDFIERHRLPGCRVDFVVERAASSKASTVPPIDNAILGTVIDLMGKERLQYVVIETADGSRRELEVDLLVIDFLSYELSPARCFTCEGLTSDESGFITVDRYQRTSVKGIFAAGDVTGMPAAVATAIGEGIVAGFEAYRYVYRTKFGQEPSLFAYYGVDEVLSERVRELPIIDVDKYAIELLSDASELTKCVCLHTESKDQIDVIKNSIDFLRQADVPVKLSDLAEESGLSTHSFERLIESWLALKAITLHPEREANDSFTPLRTAGQESRTRKRAFVSGNQTTATTVPTGIVEFHARWADIIRERLHVCVATDCHVLDSAVSYFLRRKGKLIRPLLTLLCCQVTGGKPSGALDYACAVELVVCQQY